MDRNFDTARYRKALGSFATGVAIIATVDEEREPRGFTANSFASVSLDPPPLVLVCVGETAASYYTFLKCEAFSINILSNEQSKISRIFASKRRDKFRHAQWRWNASHCSVFVDALACLECTSHERIIAGDHLILIGRVDAFRAEYSKPLVYFRGGYVPFELTNREIELGDRRSGGNGCNAIWEDYISALERF